MLLFIKFYPLVILGEYYLYMWGTAVVVISLILCSKFVTENHEPELAQPSKKHRLSLLMCTIFYMTIPSFIITICLKHSLFSNDIVPYVAMWFLIQGSFLFIVVKSTSVKSKKQLFQLRCLCSFLLIPDIFLILVFIPSLFLWYSFD